MSASGRTSREHSAGLEESNDLLQQWEEEFLNPTNPAAHPGITSNPIFSSVDDIIDPNFTLPNSNVDPSLLALNDQGTLPALDVSQEVTFDELVDQTLDSITEHNTHGSTNVSAPTDTQLQQANHRTTDQLEYDAAQTSNSYHKDQHECDETTQLEYESQFRKQYSNAPHPDVRTDQNGDSLPEYQFHDQLDFDFDTTQWKDTVQQIQNSGPEDFASYSHALDAGQSFEYPDLAESAALFEHFFNSHGAVATQGANPPTSIDDVLSAYNAGATQTASQRQGDQTSAGITQNHQESGSAAPQHTSAQQYDYPDNPLTTGWQPGFEIGYWRGPRMITAGNCWSHEANSRLLLEPKETAAREKILPALRNDQNSQVTDNVRDQLQVIRDVVNESSNSKVTKFNKSLIWPKLEKQGLTRKRKTSTAANGGENGNQQKKRKTSSEDESGDDNGVENRKPQRTRHTSDDQLPRLEPSFDPRGYIARNNAMRLIPLERLTWPGGGITPSVWDQLTAKDKNLPPSGSRRYFIDYGPNSPLSRGVDLLGTYFRTRKSERKKPGQKAAEQAAEQAKAQSQAQAQAQPPAEAQSQAQDQTQDQAQAQAQDEHQVQHQVQPEEEPEEEPEDSGREKKRKRTPTTTDDKADQEDQEEDDRPKAKARKRHGPGPGKQ